MLFEYDQHVWLLLDSKDFRLIKPSRSSLFRVDCVDIMYEAYGSDNIRAAAVT